MDLDGDAPKDGVLFQEYLRDPFWMIVACSLVNLTNWSKAKYAHAELVERYHDPYGLATAPEDELQEILRPLGLWRRRTKSLYALAGRWLKDGPPRSARDVLDLPGCGQYAADSWAIFVDGSLDVYPSDGKLRWYLSRLRTR